METNDTELFLGTFPENLIIFESSKSQLLKENSGNFRMKINFENLEKEVVLVSVNFVNSQFSIHLGVLRKDDGDLY